VTRRAQHGFSLLEVLVAFVILTLSLGVILKIFSDGMRSVDTAEHTAHAVALAQSLLATAAADPAGTQTQGEDAQQVRWEIAVRPAEAAPPAPGTALATARLLEIAVTVTWGAAPHTRSLSLSTLRVQPVLQTAP
jgi:general secretion pathway protein I